MVWENPKFSLSNEIAFSFLINIDAKLTRSMFRSEVEKTDSIQGFQVLHSIGGGSGSGFGSLLMENMKYDYGNAIINTYSIFPSEKVSRWIGHLRDFICLFDVSSQNEESSMFDWGFQSWYPWMSIVKPEGAVWERLWKTFGCKICFILRFAFQKLYSEKEREERTLLEYIPRKKVRD